MSLIKRVLIGDYLASAPSFNDAVHDFDRHPLRESAHDSPEGSEVAGQGCVCHR